MSKPILSKSLDGAALLRDRYELGEKIGEGGQGKTYRGRDLQTGATVAIKELTLEYAENWKAIELFEREGQALRNLEHEAIPEYVDAFHIDDEERGLRFFLVRQFVEGRTFQELIDDGEPIGTEAVFDFLHHLLDILEYLHQLHPPVIHRDIKPSNLILKPDGTIVLIDFGAVQVLSPHTLTGSTIVGTTGYVAPEQLAGRTVAASDLYALGATVVHLLSHVHPSDLPMSRMRLQFEEVVEGPQELMSFLDGVLDPVVEDRISTPEEARAVLDGDERMWLPRIYRSQAPLIRRRPMGTRIKVEERGDQLRIWIPARRSYKAVYWAVCGALLVGLAALLPSLAIQTTPWLIGAFAACLLGAQVFITPTKIDIDPQHFTIDRHTLNGLHRGWTQALVDVEERGPGEEKALFFVPLPAHLVLMEGLYPYHFGFGLSPIERRWVQGLLRQKLG